MTFFERYINNEPDNKVQLKRLELIKAANDKYFIHAKYEVEDANGVYEYDFPKIALPITKDCFTITKGSSYESDSVNIGFGDNYLNEDALGNMYYTSTLYTKTHKMTVSEIEKNLGYKIEIVSEKGE